MTKIFITGTAGFIGFHLAKLLLNDGSKIDFYNSKINIDDIFTVMILKKMV